MALVRRKDKVYGGVNWLSVTTAILEIEAQGHTKVSELENRLRHGEIIESPRFAYELVE